MGQFDLQAAFPRRRPLAEDVEDQPGPRFGRSQGRITAARVGPLSPLILSFERATDERSTGSVAAGRLSDVLPATGCRTQLPYRGTNPGGTNPAGADCAFRSGCI